MRVQETNIGGVTCLSVMAVSVLLDLPPYEVKIRMKRAPGSPGAIVCFEDESDKFYTTWTWLLQSDNPPTVRKKPQRLVKSDIDYSIAVDPDCRYRIAL